MYDTLTIEQGRPAWMVFDDMAADVHEKLIGGAQCKNVLTAFAACYDECDDDERRELIADALERLTRVGF